MTPNSKIALILFALSSTANGQPGTVTSANGQPACWLTGTNTAVLYNTGKAVACN